MLDSEKLKNALEQMDQLRWEVEHKKVLGTWTDEVANEDLRVGTDILRQALGPDLANPLIEALFKGLTHGKE